MTRFEQALAHLLPPGAAWPRDPSSVWMRLLFGVAGMFDELHSFTTQAVTEWQPHSTHTRLAEWEAATSLPDGCSAAVQTYAQRQARVLARLRGYKGAYADSSPAALGTIEAFCADLGYTVDARYNTPFRCGRDRTGGRLGRLDGQLHLVLHVVSVPLRCGGRAGSRLMTRTPEVGELACALEQIVPARFALVFDYV